MAHNRWTKFDWQELSAVDRPAQETATMDIRKRDEKNDYVDVASSVTDGHQHGIRVSVSNGRLDLIVMYASSPGEEFSHDHQIVRQDDGNFTLTMNNGHSHTLNQTDIESVITDAIENKTLKVSKGQTAATLRKSIPFKSRSLKVDIGDKPMTKEEKAKLEALEAENKTLKAESALSPERKAFYDSLDDTAKAAFLEKSEADQDAEIAKSKPAEKEDSEKSEDSDVSDRMAELEKQNAELRLEREIDKTLADLPNLPGTTEEKRTLVKNALAIENEADRKVQLDFLKAQSKDASKAYVTVGSSEKSEQIDKSDSEALNDKVNELAQAKVSADPSLSIEKARTLVRRENPELRAD